MWSSSSPSFFSYTDWVLRQEVNYSKQNQKYNQVPEQFLSTVWELKDVDYFLDWWWWERLYDSQQIVEE